MEGYEEVNKRDEFLLSTERALIALRLISEVVLDQPSSYVLDKVYNIVTNVGFSPHRGRQLRDKVSGIFR